MNESVTYKPETFIASATDEKWNDILYFKMKGFEWAAAKDKG